MSGPYDIYGSGDKGSAELVNEFRIRNIPYNFKDIRVAIGGQKINLVRLMDRGLRSVPQVFDPEGILIGGFDATMRVIAA